MKSKRMKRYFVVASQQDAQIQAEFENNLNFVEYVTTKGVGYRLWFNDSGICVEIADDLCNKDYGYDLVLMPNQSSFSPGVDISAKTSKK